MSQRWSPDEEADATNANFLTTLVGLRNLCHFDCSGILTCDGCNSTRVEEDQTSE